MKIGVVIHGPTIIDSGWAEKIIKMLKKLGEVKAKLGGTMGRVAVIDNNLENLIDISEKIMPSESLKRLSEEADILFLLNYGKSKETGHTFGKIVVSRANIKKPVIQIERPGERDGSIIVWNYSEELNNILEFLKEHLNLNIEKCSSKGLEVWEENNKVFRKVHGVSPGETILVNGVVVGRAKEREVILVAEDGKIIDIIGGELKEEGVERLKNVDLNKAIIKTGILRKKANKLRVKEGKDEGYVSIIDHAGEDCIEKAKDFVITIGDDTTQICGDILSRFGVKIIGVTDGDADKIIEEPKFTDGSVILLVKNVRDDHAGEILKKNLKERKYKFDELVEEVEKIFKNYGIEYEKIKK
ncbi:conserved hypothetical protein [Methanocaldococcus infernus ME]|uniref:DUF2117 domain-containing protein n=1 Tax=Methanocaldococcus infernus (strain DSM 11812 / JCM 15783 / ME) TaxID=573063 RepID=D5VTW9_METIM|nr:DUF2117 domain-containing protein [Methanocaldococcus infernus]ADG14022.1 conserved hypothetical protein [Methanocaldococcus infernus ME]